MACASSPSTKTTPAMTRPRSSEPLRRRQPLEAARANCQTIVKVAMRDPQPLVRSVRRRTVAKVLSIGLVFPVRVNAGEFILVVAGGGKRDE